MKSTGRIAVWFLALLIGVYALDGLFMYAFATLNEATIRSESHTWSVVRGYGGLEGLYWLFYVVLFVAAGVVLASKSTSQRSSLLLALLLGFLFVAVRYVDGPRILYSHAPLWLWALAWADFYVPPIASIGGAALWHRMRARRARAHAA